MSIREKPWVNSIFSQFSVTQPLKSSPKKSPKAKGKSLKRSRSFAEGSTKPKISTRRTSQRTKLALENEITVEELPKTTKLSNVSSSSNWIESFAPQAQEDLAVHAKKLQELQDWFNHCTAVGKQYPAQLCLLTGPSGVGKTAALQVYAKANKYQIQEWINPVDREVITGLGDQQFGDSYMASQIDGFKSFLLRASRYKSLFDTFSKRLLLVEDFPNALIKDPVAFEEILGDYMNYGKSPLVFIVADSKSRGLNISYNLFTDQLKLKYRVTHISFNPIASTLLHKAMKRFCSIMRQPAYAELYKVPQQSVLDSIVVSAQGDIRNALINLHFASLKGAPAMEINIAANATGTEKGKRKREHKLKSVGRDESLTMMHALGRVFNPKFQVDNPKLLLHSPELIAEQFSTEPKKFIDFVHANYLPHYGNIEHVLAASKDLCIADMLMQDYREDILGLLGLNVGVRSVMLNNLKPVSAWLPTRGPKRLNSITLYCMPGSELIERSANITCSKFALDYSTFAKIILDKRGGVGGVFK